MTSKPRLSFYNNPAPHFCPSSRHSCSAPAHSLSSTRPTTQTPPVTAHAPLSMRARFHLSTVLLPHDPTEVSLPRLSHVYCPSQHLSHGAKRSLHFILSVSLSLSLPVSPCLSSPLSCLCLTLSLSVSPPRSSSSFLEAGPSVAQAPSLSFGTALVKSPRSERQSRGRVRTPSTVCHQ